MSDLTPIPAEQRRAYYDALLAGRAEAERLGYGLMDDRIFGAFHRALYSPMLHAHEREVRAKVAEEIQAARRTDISSLLEGRWNDAIETATGIARGHAQPAQIDAAARKPGGGSATKDDTRDDRQEQ